MAARREACYPDDASGPGLWRVCRYLTRLEADLTAADMKKDARFVKSERAGPFQETIIGGERQGLLLLFVAALALLADEFLGKGIDNLEQAKYTLKNAVF